MNPYLRPVLESVGLDDALRYFVRLHGVEHVAERLANAHGDAGIWQMLVKRYPEPRDRQAVLEAIGHESYVPPPVAAPSEWWCEQREEAIHATR